MFIGMWGLQRFIGWAEGARTSYARQGESPQDFLITKCLESCTEKKEGKLDERNGVVRVLKNKAWSLK